MTRRKFDKEFKQTIVDLLSIDNPKSIDTICAEYDLKKATVYRWLKEFKTETALEAENKLLKKQLKNAQEERDILKKAVSIFSERDK